MSYENTPDELAEVEITIRRPFEEHDNLGCLQVGGKSIIVESEKGTKIKVRKMQVAMIEGAGYTKPCPPKPKAAA